MRRFKYKAKKSASEVSEGVLVAASQDEAIDKINDMGLVPVHIEEEKDPVAPAPESQKKAVVTGEKVPSRLVTHFYRQFSRFIKSGIPLLPALTIVSEQTEHSVFKNVLEKIKERIREGHAFAKSLSGYPQIFSSFDVAMAEAGESVGKMDEALARVARYRKSQEEVMSKVRLALAYPILVVTLAVGALVFMLTYVIPKFSRFFEDLGQQLPLPTRILLVGSQKLQATWPFLVGILAVFLLCLRFSLKSPKQRIGWHRFFLKLPVAGKLILMSQVARFCRTLELLLKSGISLLRSIRIALPVLTNDEVKNEFGVCYQLVEHGGAFSEALRKLKIVPLFVVHLVKIGEESGKLDESLGDIADWYEQEVDEHIKIMTQLLEPIIILVVGAVLGFIAVAILLPVFSMNAIIS